MCEKFIFCSGLGDLLCNRFEANTVCMRTGIGLAPSRQIKSQGKTNLFPFLPHVSSLHCCPVFIVSNTGNEGDLYGVHNPFWH